MNWYIRIATIRRKTITLIVAIVVSTILLASISVLIYEVKFYRPNEVSKLRSEAAMLATPLAPSLMFLDTRSAKEQLDKAHAIAGVKAAEATTVDGEVLATFADDAGGPAKLGWQANNSSYFFSGNMLTLVQPISRDNETLGYLSIRKQLPPLYAHVPQYGIMAITLGLALGFVALSLLLGLEKTILNPIRKLSQLVQQVTAERNYSLRIETRSKDEVGSLATAINFILQTIEADFVALNQAERSLRDSESKLIKFLEWVPLGVLVTDADGTAVFMNQRALKLLDQTESSAVSIYELLNVFPFYLAGTLERYPVKQLPIVRALTGLSGSVENLEIRHADQVIQIEMTAAPIYAENDQIQFAITTLLDITERVKAQQHTLFLAYHDPLTGLVNRRGFHDRLEQSLALAKRHTTQVALIFIDLDRFKPINDTYGHNIADNLLLSIGERLKNNVREIDFVARLGGDEFAVVLTDLESVESGLTIAQQLLAILARPYNFDYQAVVITASMGVSLFPVDSSTSDGLVRCAARPCIALNNRAGMASLYITRIWNAMSKDEWILRKDCEVH